MSSKRRLRRRCESKRRYTKAEAIEAARIMGGKYRCAFWAYKCKIHGCYHIGNINPREKRL